MNGVPFGAPVAIAAFGAAAAWFDVPYAPGTLVAEGLALDGATVLASDTAASWGPPAALVLSLDAPSPRTGTGAALLLDGADAALVRATVVDADGNACGDAAILVSFAVSAGPALVVGTHNGDPALQQPASAAAVPAFHGLARAVVRVTLAAAGAAADRAIVASVNVDAGRGGRSSAVLAGDAPPPTAAVVVASAPGLPQASVSIALSVDARDGVLAVAAASVGSADVGT